MGKNIQVSDLMRIVEESTKEFRAILGKNVDSENKKNNEKAYKDIEKAVKDYDGGLRVTNDAKKRQVISTNDDNRGMESLVYGGNSATKEFRDNVKSQMKGYTSKKNEDLHKDEPFGNAFFGGDLSNVEDKQKEFMKDKLTGKTMGLTGRETKKELANAANSSVFEGKGKNMKQLYFKKTEFINEEHITSKIPDEFKNENSQFMVKDKGGNEYLIEWRDNKANIIWKKNVKALNEELNRIQELFNYKSPFAESDKHSRMVDEDKEFKNMLNNARILGS